MAIAIASALGKHVGGQPLFREVSFKLEPGDRMTLSGRNGAGKTTLLRVLAGELPPDDGELVLQKGARVGLHDQRPPRDNKGSLGDYVLSGLTHMTAIEKDLSRLETAMAEGAHDEETLSAYSTAQAELEHAGGYRWRDQALAVARGLGFGEEELERDLGTFSGGELTRAALSRVLAMRPDLMLLDEPTNHLDIPSLEWLETYLAGIDSAVVLVAHDRWFLEAVGTSVLELEAGRARFFSGPWHAWRTEKAAREIAAGRAIERQEAEIARMERFVERFRAKATKAKQAQSRVKKIDKVKANATTLDPSDNRKLSFQFAAPERSGRTVLELEEGRIEVPGRTLLDEAQMHLERGEHTVLVGANGTGKTTLLEVLAGQSELAAGKLRRGHKAKIGYLSQHADTAAGEGTVLEAATREVDGLTGQEVRGLLGRFLFSGQDVDKRLSDISGGEQRRLSLAILVASGANVLILDEPTNHLDVDSREALEDALSSFEGAVLLVSHDRALLEAVGVRTIAVEDGTLNTYPVGWSDYQVIVTERRREARQAEAGSNGSTAADKGAGAKSANGSGGGSKVKPLSKNAKRQIASIEQQIEVAERELAEVEVELADPQAWSSPGRTERSTKRHAEAKRKVEELYASLEASSA